MLQGSLTWVLVASVRPRTLSTPKTSAGVPSPSLQTGLMTPARRAAGEHVRGPGRNSPSLPRRDGTVLEPSWETKIAIKYLNYLAGMMAIVFRRKRTHLQARPCQTQALTRTHERPHPLIGKVTEAYGRDCCRAFLPPARNPFSARGLPNPVPGRKSVMTGSCRLLPLRVDSDQTADGAGQAHKAVVERGPCQRRGGNGQVAEVGEELKLAGGSLAMGLSVTRVAGGAQGAPSLTGQFSWPPPRPRPPSCRPWPRAPSGGTGCRSGPRR